MLPPVFFSTASRTEKQSAKGKRTLSILQIEIIHKKDSHKFPDKIIFFGGGGIGLRGEGCFDHKSIYWLDFEILFCFFGFFFALSNLTRNVKFLTERKRSYLIFSYDSQHFGCILHVYSRGFDCVSQKTSYLID